MSTGKMPQLAWKSLGQGRHWAWDTQEGPLSLETGTLAWTRPPPPTSQWMEAQHSPGLRCRGPHWPSAPPAPSRSCGHRRQSSRPRRRRCSSRGCSSETRPGPSSQLGHPPRAWPAGPLPPSLRSLWLAPDPLPAAGLRWSRAAAPSRLSLTSEAGIPPPSCPGTAHPSPRGTVRGLGRGLCYCEQPAGPSLDRGQRAGGSSCRSHREPATDCLQTGHLHPVGHQALWGGQAAPLLLWRGCKGLKNPAVVWG